MSPGTLFVDILERRKDASFDALQRPVSQGTSVLNGIPICVLGMHRSGTSMFAALLHDCGVSLGKYTDLMPPSPDNPKGYWENQRFVEINDAVLEVLGGTWDHPPLLESYDLKREELAPLRERARVVVKNFEGSRFWGWKDPRTCLTLPFWKEVVPNAKMVICIRHPMEVAQSLSARKFSQVERERSLELWGTYYASLMPAVEDDSFLVTHYVSYFFDPEAELKRVFEFIGHTPGKQQLAKAVETVRPELWHGFCLDYRNSYFEMPHEVQEMYARLCDLAGPVFERQRVDPVFQEQLRAAALEKAIARIAALEQLYDQRTKENEQLATYVRDLRNGMNIYTRLAIGVARRLRQILRVPANEPEQKSKNGASLM